MWGVRKKVKHLQIVPQIINFLPKEIQNNKFSGWCGGTCLIIPVMQEVRVGES
jgi:hypothetical protein